jgi:NitT/TauT family transport system substrate-binding protein
LPARSRTRAEELAIGNYGVSANGMPFGVALQKGYFKEEGLNITGTHHVGRRRHVAPQHARRWWRPLRRGESWRSVSAIIAGADLRIISDNVLTLPNSSGR